MDQGWILGRCCQAIGLERVGSGGDEEGEWESETAAACLQGR